MGLGVPGRNLEIRRPGFRPSRGFGFRAKTKQRKERTSNITTTNTPAAMTTPHNAQTWAISTLLSKWPVMLTAVTSLSTIPIVGGTLLTLEVDVGLTILPGVVIVVLSKTDVGASTMILSMNGSSSGNDIVVIFSIPSTEIERVCWSMFITVIFQYSTAG